MTFSNKDIEIDGVKILDTNQKYLKAIVEFKNDAHCSAVFDFLNSPRFKDRFKNKDKKPIKIQFALDSSRMENSGWVAVVLRNLPREGTKAVVVANGSQKGEKVIYATNPIKVKDMYGCIVRVKTIEDAEKIGRRLNQKRKDKDGIYADIHPNSNYKRTSSDAKSFDIFKNVKYFPHLNTSSAVQILDEVAELENPQQDASIIASLTHQDSRYNRTVNGKSAHGLYNLNQIKKKLDGESENSIRSSKILSLLSEISKRKEDTSGIDLTEISHKNKLAEANNDNSTAPSDTEYYLGYNFVRETGEDELEGFGKAGPNHDKSKDYEVNFVKKRRVKLASKEQPLTFGDEKSCFILYNEKEEKHSELMEDTLDFKREYYKDKMRREKINLVQKQ